MRSVMSTVARHIVIVIIALSIIPAISAMSGCTTTTIGCTDMHPGHELALRVKSGRSSATLTNHGPGAVLLVLDAQGEEFDVQTTVEPGTRPLRLKGWTDLWVRNLPGPNAQPVSVTLIVDDPCKFAGGARPMATK